MRWICEALDVSRGGMYEWLRRAPSARARRDAQLSGEIAGALPRAIARTAHAACIVICALGVTNVANVEYGA